MGSRPESQGKGREGAAGVCLRAEQCQYLFLGVTQPYNYAEPRGCAGATVPMLGRRPGRDPSIVTATPARCARCAPVTGLTAGVLPARVRGARLEPRSRQAGPAGLGHGCSGSWRWTCRDGPFPAARSHCLPSDKRWGLVFSLLEKMSGPRMVSARQEELGAREGLHWPTLPPRCPSPGSPPALRPAWGDAGWGPSRLAPDPQGPPGQHGDHGFTLLPGQSGARALGALPWFLGCSEAPPNRWAAQLCQEDAHPPFHPDLAGGRCEDVGPQAPACGWPAAWPSNPPLMRPDSLHQGRWVPGAPCGLRRRAPPPNKRPPVRCLCPIAA